MATLHIYDKLLQFTLFQGMSKADLEQVVAHTKLGFQTYTPAETIALAQATCNCIFFLVDGTVNISTSSTDNGYTVTETLHSPLLFEQSALFGLTPNFTSTYRALSACSVIFIEKSEISKMLGKFNIFRLNFINLLSAHIQKQHTLHWQTPANDIRQRIIHFIACRCRVSAGEKKINIKMTRLADELGCRRLTVSKALNQLQTEGHITLHRGGFRIHALERLMM